ncbi:MAG: lipid A deacylase LpxR family protein, partial [Usitatibacter sp.]
EATLTLDNDFFAGFDRHYTNGFQVAVLGDTASLPRPIRALHPFGSAVDKQYTFAIGQRIYTPADKAASSPDPDDRPYAGWLYALAEFRMRRDVVLDHFMVSVGVVGPASLARQSQDAVHRIIGDNVSQGWHAQIHNEPALLLAYERAWPRAAPVSFEGLQFDLTPRVGATVGNVLTYANAGAIARVGRGLPDDFPATHITLGPARDGYRANTSSSGWYMWVGADARVVARNLFLDGNTFRASPSVERKPFGWDAQLGVAATWGHRRLGLSLVRRSEEFATQGKSDKFGQLTYSFEY